MSRVRRERGWLVSKLWREAYDRGEAIKAGGDPDTLPTTEWAVEAEIVTIEDDRGLGLFVKGTAKAPGKIAVHGKKLQPGTDVKQMRDNARALAKELVDELCVAAAG